MSTYELDADVVHVATSDVVATNLAYAAQQALIRDLKSQRINPKPILALDFVDDTLTSIRTKLVDNRFEDDALAPDLMAKVLTELREASQTEGVLGLWAGNLLQSLWHRAETGIPYGEPAEVDL